MESRARRSRRNLQVAKHGRRARIYWRRIKKMPHGGGTKNVGVQEEMESHIDLIHEGPSETVLLAHKRGDSVRRSDYSRKVGELNMDHGSSNIEVFKGAMNPKAVKKEMRDGGWFWSFNKVEKRGGEKSLML
ncbi:hypothetical protein Acr_22g0006890 [Actinidia rufa]|uniref:Uncharacterized protein n=1 Tax=Actinidia rufa TaxID=165716 RepID=A0A7J0GKM5_9ERIC|nr:hypothetical protein Acr_22g0006890 [Actinidia rufa]